MCQVLSIIFLNINFLYYIIIFLSSLLYLYFLIHYSFSLREGLKILSYTPRRINVINPTAFGF